MTADIATSETQAETRPEHDHDVCPRCASYERDIAELHEKITEQIRLLNVVVDNIRPVLDSMAASPIGRMFGLENSND